MKDGAAHAARGERRPFDIDRSGTRLEVGCFLIFSSKPTASSHVETEGAGNNPLGEAK